MKKEDLKLSLAPIQGITDYIFRNTFNKYFNSVDEYFAPYLRINKEKQFKKSKLKDILPENNSNTPLIPQIITNNTEDFLLMANYISDLGYKELNWNLGCPYPMVTNRELGAGLLPHHNKICNILDEVIPKIKTKLSIKLRSGLTNDTELEKLLPKLNTFPLSEIIIHPRYAKQLYKEEADIKLFIKCMQLSTHNLCYNGDINSIEIFKSYYSELKTITRFMLGRGLLANPFLANEIKNTKTQNTANKKTIFHEFHESLFNAYTEKLVDKNHVLTKMKGLWVYFSDLFVENKKVNKKIKKSSSLTKYNNSINEIFREYTWNNSYI